MKQKTLELNESSMSLDVKSVRRDMHNAREEERKEEEEWCEWASHQIRYRD